MVEKYPDLIAGYNTMPKAQKEKFNSSGYSLMMKKSFMLVGLVIMLLGMFIKIYWPTGFLFSVLMPLLGLVLFLNLKSPQFK